MKKISKQWKFIVLYDENKKEMKKFELDPDGKLKQKIKRSKKRSLSKNTNITPPKEKKEENKQNFLVSTNPVLSYLEDFRQTPETFIEYPISLVENFNSNKSIVTTLVKK